MSMYTHTQINGGTVSRGMFLRPHSFSIRLTFFFRHGLQVPTRRSESIIACPADPGPAAGVYCLFSLKSDPSNNEGGNTIRTELLCLAVFFGASLRCMDAHHQWKLAKLSHVHSSYTSQDQRVYELVRSHHVPHGTFLTCIAMNLVMGQSAWRKC